MKFRPFLAILFKLGLPGFFWIITILSIVLGFNNIEIFGFAVEWGKPAFEWCSAVLGKCFSSIGELYSGATSSGFAAGAILVPLVSIVAFLIFGLVILVVDGAIILLALAAVVGSVFLPLCMLDGAIGTENMFLWISCLMFVLTSISAFFFKFGEFLEDSTYIAGYELIAEEDGWGKVKIHSEPVYKGGGEIIANIWLFAIRMALIALFGSIIFLVSLYRLIKA